jgi:hypothetical protein
MRQHQTHIVLLPTNTAQNIIEQYRIDKADNSSNVSAQKKHQS